MIKRWGYIIQPFASIRKDLSSADIIFNIGPSFFYFAVSIHMWFPYEPQALDHAS
jgi:uncharacterized membrane protein